MSSATQGLTGPGRKTRPTGLLSYRQKKRLVPLLYVLPATLLFSLLMLFPMITVIRYSLMDGADELQKFWYITIPQLMPIIISIALLDFIWTMQVFPLIWMTTGGGPIYATEVLSTCTYKLAFSKYEFALASASSIFILMISMSMTYFYIKHQKAR